MKGTLIMCLLLLLYTAGSAQTKPQIYAGMDLGVTHHSLNTNLHLMMKYYGITTEPVVRLYTMGQNLLMAGGRIGYEYGEVVSITPFTGLYYSYSGNTTEDKLLNDGVRWEYGMRLKWCPSTLDAAGLYVDISSMKRLHTTDRRVIAVTFGMTVFEPNNRQ